MVKKVSTSEARARFGDVVNSVYYSKEPVAVEKKGKILAVLISPEQFQVLQDADAHAWATVQAIKERNASLDPDEITSMVTEEVEAARGEAHETKRAS